MNSNMVHRTECECLKCAFRRMSAANAHLREINAELLAACKITLGRLTGKGIGRVESAQHVANRLDAAIKKAEGRK